MSAGTQEATMPRKPKSDDGKTMKLDEQLYNDIQIVARAHGQRATPWLEELLRPIIQEKLAEVWADIGTRLDPKRTKR